MEYRTNSAASNTRMCGVENWVLIRGRWVERPIPVLCGLFIRGGWVHRLTGHLPTWSPSTLTVIPATSGRNGSNSSPHIWNPCIGQKWVVTCWLQCVLPSAVLLPWGVDTSPFHVLWSTVVLGWVGCRTSIRCTWILPPAAPTLWPSNQTVQYYQRQMADPCQYNHSVKEFHWLSMLSQP